MYKGAIDGVLHQASRLQRPKLSWALCAASVTCCGEETGSLDDIQAAPVPSLAAAQLPLNELDPINILCTRKQPISQEFTVFETVSTLLQYA